MHDDSSLSLSRRTPYDADQHCPCLCALIIFTTIPPGNKHAAPTPPPAVPLPPLCIWPLNWSALPYRQRNAIMKAPFGPKPFIHRTGRDRAKERTFVLLLQTKLAKAASSQNWTLPSFPANNVAIELWNLECDRTDESGAALPLFSPDSKQQLHCLSLEPC